MKQSKVSKNLIDDGFRADLAKNGIFDGSLEIIRIKRPMQLIIPEDTIPFSLMHRSERHSEFVVFYEYDLRFAEVLTSTEQFLEDLKMFPGVISPDCSVYRDMPLCLQIANTYMNRLIGHYLQEQGLYVIPNIRWGDERSYTTAVLPEKFAFLGVEKHSIVSVGTYGCIRSRTNRDYFKAGLDAMLEELEPEVVIVYGSMPDSLFGEYRDVTTFVQMEDWISKKRRHG